MLQVISIGAVLAWLNAMDKTTNERQVREVTKRFLMIEIEHLGNLIQLMLPMLEDLSCEKQAFLLDEIFRKYDQIQKRIGGSL